MASNESAATPTRRFEQPARVVEDERRLPDADRVGAHERDPVARPVAGPAPGRAARQRLAGGHDVVADPAVALAAEREADLGEHGQVAGAERARARARTASRPRAARSSSASSSSSPTPAPPAPSWLARTAIAARTTSTVSGAPPPPAWLRSSRHWWSPGSSLRGRLRPQHADAGRHAVEQVAALEQLARRGARPPRCARGPRRSSAPPRPPRAIRDHVRGREAAAVERDHGGVMTRRRANSVRSRDRAHRHRTLAARRRRGRARRRAGRRWRAEARAAMEASAAVVARLADRVRARLRRVDRLRLARQRRDPRRAPRGAPARARALARRRHGPAGRARGRARDDAAARPHAGDGLLRRAARRSPRRCSRC